VHLLALDLWKLDARGGVARQPSPFNGRAEDLREHLERLAGTLGRQAIRKT
jgi:hypothetical protein